jgi:hypothetical protein
MENSANAVLAGYLQDVQSGIRLRLQLLDAHELVKKTDGKMGSIEDVTFANLSGDLAPAEPFDQLPRSDPEHQPTNAASYRDIATTFPRALRAPNPPYTNAARIAKFKGSLIL